MCCVGVGIGRNLYRVLFHAWERFNLARGRLICLFGFFLWRKQRPHVRGRCVFAAVWSLCVNEVDHARRLILL